MGAYSPRQEVSHSWGPVRCTAGYLSKSASVDLPMIESYMRPPLQTNGMAELSMVQILCFSPTWSDLSSTEFLNHSICPEEWTVCPLP